MGGTKDYLKSGGFIKQGYLEVGIINGIKEIDKIGAKNNNTPMFSNTPYTMYASRNTKSGDIQQVAIYARGDGRGKFKDIDIGHPHKNKDAKQREFLDYEIHVHVYSDDDLRGRIARKPSKKERRLLMLARNKR